MKRRIQASLFAVAASAALSLAAGLVHADPVDLSDKKGVVDPADLKKDDPPPRSLHINEPPPPPPPEPANDHYEVKVSGDTPHTNQGN